MSNCSVTWYRLQTRQRGCNSANPRACSGRRGKLVERCLRDDLGASALSGDSCSKHCRLIASCQVQALERRAVNQYLDLLGQQSREVRAFCEAAQIAQGINRGFRGREGIIAAKQQLVQNSVFFRIL
jgi:hypothetical protein